MKTKMGVQPGALPTKVGKTPGQRLRRALFLIFSMGLTAFSGTALAQPKSAPNNSLVVRMARLVIDPEQLERYKAALKEEIQTSVRVEPGVLALNAVYDKKQPTQVTILEIYANDDAYKAHLQTPHFKKYKSTTLNMVKSLELVDVVPIALESKLKQ
ncbi:putative quinol monooxygenase [Larkinella arboricola]